MALEGKHIIVGLSGGIAAYKTLTLVRLLVKAGAEVRCVCTPSALQFVTPLSLATLSGHPVYSDVFSPYNESSTAHVSYADWADCLVVAPATAGTLGKFAGGIADNALTTLFTAFDKVVMVSPAMNTRMYRHPSTMENLQKLRSWGVHVIPADTGLLACGAEGEGRMPDPERIFRYIEDFFAARSAGPLHGKKILITAGPTQEAIDPVRYISNRSTGLMGCCIADELTGRGAQVYLVHGPMRVGPKSRVFCERSVVSAKEMYEASMALWPEMDMAVLSAAVADYTPMNPSVEKIKKQEGQMNLPLSKTADILASMGQTKRKNQLLVGFALETEHEIEYAQGKLQRKNADLLVLNSLRDGGAGFGTVTNKVTFLDKAGHIRPMDLKSKEEVAGDLADYMESLYAGL